jgi:hypothetical protein
MYVPFFVFCVLFVCKCVVNRVSTQMQLTNNNNINNNNNNIVIALSNCLSQLTKDKIIQNVPRITL